MIAGKQVIYRTPLWQLAPISRPVLISLFRTLCVSVLLLAGLYGCATQTLEHNALITAATAGDNLKVAKMLGQGADPNLMLGDGTTALFMATQQGNTDTVNLLLNAGANINSQGYRGATPLLIAATTGHTDIVDILIKRSAVVDIPRDDHATPLFMAAQGGYLGIVNLLVAAGAQVDKAAYKGATSLFIAAQNGHHPVVKALAEKGADVNLGLENGTTPLLAAALKGHMSVSRILLQFGARPDAANNSGMTPMQAARQEGYPELATLLSKALATPILADARTEQAPGTRPKENITKAVSAVAAEPSRKPGPGSQAVDTVKQVANADSEVTKTVKPVQAPPPVMISVAPTVKTGKSPSDINTQVTKPKRTTEVISITAAPEPDSSNVAPQPAPDTKPVVTMTEGPGREAAPVSVTPEPAPLPKQETGDKDRLVASAAAQVRVSVTGKPETGVGDIAQKSKLPEQARIEQKTKASSPKAPRTTATRPLAGENQQPDKEVDRFVIESSRAAEMPVRKQKRDTPNLQIATAGSKRSLGNGVTDVKAEQAAKTPVTNKETAWKQATTEITDKPLQAGGEDDQLDGDSSNYGWSAESFVTSVAAAVAVRKEDFTDVPGTKPLPDAGPEIVETDNTYLAAVEVEADDLLVRATSSRKILSTAKTPAETVKNVANGLYDDRKPLEDDNSKEPAVAKQKIKAPGRIKAFAEKKVEPMQGLYRLTSASPIYTSPHSYAPWVRSYSAGKKVEVNGYVQGGEWYRINYSGGEGYIQSRWLVAVESDNGTKPAAKMVASTRMYSGLAGPGEAAYEDTGRDNKVALAKISKQSSTAQPDGDAQQRYKHALTIFQKSDYLKAKRSFTEFLELYPDHFMAGNAIYWLGVSNYRIRDYEQAASSFLRLYKQFPDNDKAADGLLNLSNSLNALGKQEAACSTLEQLRNEYPEYYQRRTRKIKDSQGKTGCT